MDNRQPEANFTKSDTYFIVYRDTTQMEESELATMAVNRMPEYFRSQRQIIIDTEKLIAKRKKLPAKEFNSTSNEIGFDQKVLRLRYGQFMGEEFETNIGGGPGEFRPDDHADDGGSLEGFMHKHDTEEEHAAVVEAPRHDHGPTTPADQQDPLAALMEQYVHAHDDAEVNTFHEQSTRSLLKMALEQMWQSELHLRLYEPEKALPFENKALEYLKTAQQKARTYVKKSGFDPPPLKIKETRLTGELDKINPRYQQERRYEQEQLALKVGRVLGYLELTRLTAAQRTEVQQVGTQLAETTINSGLKNWAVLGDLQKLASGKIAYREGKSTNQNLSATPGQPNLANGYFPPQRPNPGSRFLATTFMISFDFSFNSSDPLHWLTAILLVAFPVIVFGILWKNNTLSSRRKWLRGGLNALLWLILLGYLSADLDQNLRFGPGVAGGNGCTYRRGPPLAG